MSLLFHLFRSPFARVIQLPDQRAKIESAVSRWNGGTILQIGCSDVTAAVELARRGVRMVGIDPSAERVERARDLTKTACTTHVFDKIEFHQAALTPESAKVLQQFAAEPADVAIIEELPEGAEVTLALELLLKCSRSVLLHESMRSRVPDRFHTFAKPAVDGLYFFLDGSPAEAPPKAFRTRTIATKTGTAPGEQSSFVALNAMLHKTAPSANLSINGEPIVAAVHDGGFESDSIDAASLTNLIPDRSCSVVSTGTRTDRFSREHITSLGGFDEIWVPGAFARRAAIESGVLADQVRVVRETVDIQQFHPRPRMERNFKVLAMASVNARIGEAVAAACAFVNSLGNEDSAELTILCGPSVNPAEVDSAVTLALAGNRSQKIQIIGAKQHQEMPALYCEFDLFLRPTSGERRATAILEAMACGVPVAATRFGITASIVTLTNGYPIEANSIEACDPTKDDVRADEAGHVRAVASLASIEEALRAAFEDWEGRLARSGEARKFITMYHAPEIVANVIRNIPWPETKQNTNVPAALPIEESTETVEEAAAALEPRVLLDSGENAAPLHTQIDAAAAARELWCYTQLASEGWKAAGFAPRNIHFVPPAVDTKVFHPQARPAVVPTRKRTRILVDARNDYYSGADLALRAFAEAKLQNAALIVMGAKPETRASLEQLASSQPSSVEVVFMHEPASDAARASTLTACDLLLDFSRTGSRGTLLIEAAACGRPAVAAACAQPDGILSNLTGYPAPAKLKLAPLALDTFATPPIFCEVYCEEAAKLIQLAMQDSAGRARRGAAARELALQFGPAREAQWIRDRKSALAAAPSNEVMLAFVAPAGTTIDGLPSDTEYYTLRGNAERGGLAEEASQLISSLSTDFVIIASGPFVNMEKRRPGLAERLIQPMADDANVSLTFARDENGAILAMRPALLRTCSFSQGFHSTAFFVDFARHAAETGYQVAPVSDLNISFEKTGERFHQESQCVETLSQLREYIKTGEIEKGVDLLNVIMHTLPSYPAACETAAELFLAIGEPGEAIPAQTKAAAVDARNPVGYFKLAQILSQLGRRQEALLYFKTAHALAPSDLDLSTVYGEALIEAGQYSKAASLLLTTLQNHPGANETAELAAHALQQLGRGEDAAQILNNLNAAPAEFISTGV
ncbi:MAG: glycosyltransferase [Planctomycetota bacterium]